jgi:hypothetical protein
MTRCPLQPEPVLGAAWPLQASVAAARRTEKLAAAPAPASTTTSLKPAFFSAATPWGVRATRRSFSYVSRGMPAGRCAAWLGW